MKDNKRIAIFALSAISVILLALGSYLWIALRNSEAYNVEIQELMALEKEEMLNDLTSAQIQYDELMVRINNDSLRFKLEREQIRTQQLLEELEQVKSTSATEITRLKKELKAVRAVLKNYVIQIDSLNRENETLKKENKAVRNKYKEASKKIDNLSEEKQALSEKVTLASQLDATGVQMSLLRSNGKATNSIKITKCSNYGDVYSVYAGGSDIWFGTWTGGIVGYAYGGFVDSDGKAHVVTIQSCYNSRLFILCG